VGLNAMDSGTNRYGGNTAFKPNDSTQANNNNGNKLSGDFFKKGDSKSDPLNGNGFTA
jgi:hypothetical protein